MNRRLIFPLMVIGLCSSMLFGCEDNNIDVEESHSVETRIEAQEIKKSVQYGRISDRKFVFMRREPRYEGSKIHRLFKNDTVEILSENDTLVSSYGWSLVKYRDTIGYVRTSNLEFLPSVDNIGIEESKKDITRIGSSENFNVSQPADEFQKVESISLSFYLLPSFMLIIITIFILFIYWRKIIKKKASKVEISLETKENVMKDESDSKSVQMKNEISSHTTNKREFSLETKKALMKDGFDSLSDQLWGLFKTVENTLNEMVVELQKRVNVLEEELAKTRLRLKDVSIQVKEKDMERHVILSESNKQREEFKNKLDNAESEKCKAVKEKEKQWSDKYYKLDDLYQNASQQAREYKKKWESEESQRIVAEKKVQDKEEIIKERDKTIQRKDEEMKEYSARAVLFLSVQVFCQKVMNFFDIIDKLLYHTNQLKVNVPSEVNADDYNYYLTRIERKYYSIEVSDLNDWKREIQMLSLTGMVPSKGVIDSILGINPKTGKYRVDETQWESTLRMLLYDSVMSNLAGAAVTMSDELAYMLPQMVPGVASNKVFVDITESLKDAIKELGYDLNYVKPFTQLTKYENVKNVKFTDADVPQGTIFEIMKMALNYGSIKKKTEVSAK